MEKEYPTLRRPKGKLCYVNLGKKTSPSTKWQRGEQALSMGDIDKVFDDLVFSEASSNSDDVDILPKRTQEEGHPTQKISQSQKDNNENFLQPATKSPSFAPDIDFDFKFSKHRPLKTSSPIEENTSPAPETVDIEKHRVSPILFPCEDVERQEGKMACLYSPKPQFTGQISKQNKDSKLDSPPRKLVLSKSKMHSPKKMVKGLWQENPDPPTTAASQTPFITTQKKKPEAVGRQQTTASTCVTRFLQKLREASQPRPSCSKKSLPPVKVPSPPEDEFLILEDDAPFSISIPSKFAVNKRPNKTYSVDKDSSTKKRMKETTGDSAQKQQEPDQADGKLENQKMERNEKNQLTGPGCKIPEFCSEELPADDLMEREKTNKKKRLKKLPSKHDKAEDPTEDSARGERDEERKILEVGKKAQTPSDKKESKHFKEKVKNRKASKPKSVKETLSAELMKEHQEPRREEQTGAEGLGPLQETEIINSEAQRNEKDRRREQVFRSEGSSSEDEQVVGCRKRRPPGQWWLSTTQPEEETEAPENHPTLKKSKQKIKEPVKSKKDRVSKRRNQTPASPSSGPKKDQVQRNKRPDAVEAEPIEEAQEQIQEHFQTSPLVLVGSDPSLNSGRQVFPQVYHKVANEKMSTEDPRIESPVKRRRRPPGNWWKVDEISEDVQIASLQTLQQEPKPRKERKKKAHQGSASGVRAPKNGTVAASLKPAGGTPATPLNVQPLSGPKTVERSLRTFKDTVTSDAEIPSAASGGEAAQENRREVTASHAVEVTVIDSPAPSGTEGAVLSADAGGAHHPRNLKAPWNRKRQSADMLKSLNSGPSSMIALEQDGDSDDSTLPSSRVSPALSASDLCAAPLKPIALQPSDKANMTEWFKSLWSITADNGPEITADHFDWFFYQGRVVGFMVDLNCGPICSGKMLLGSYMKKPLWVDHSATTVFNILTSSVSVIIDGRQSRFNPGQTFMVACGCAYSIQNILSQPAAMSFTRVFVDSSDQIS